MYILIKKLLNKLGLITLDEYPNVPNFEMEYLPPDWNSEEEVGIGYL